MAREREIESYGNERFAKELGALVRKVQWVNQNGAPDRMVAFDGIIWFIEYKATGKKPRVQQQREIGRMREAGIRVAVVDSKETVDHMIHWYKTGRHLFGAPTFEQVTKLYDMVEPRWLKDSKLDLFV